MSAAVGFFCQGLKNEFEIDMVNESSVFEPQKFYCIQIWSIKIFEDNDAMTDSMACLLN